MNVVTSLRADEDIGPYQLLRPQLCDITQKFTSVMRQAVALGGTASVPSVSVGNAIGTERTRPEPRA